MICNYFKNGSFLLDHNKEKALSEYLKNRLISAEPLGYPEHNKTVDITVSLGLGTAEAEVLGSDLSYEHVRENAEYTS